MKRLKKTSLVLIIICVVAIIIKSQIRLVKLSDHAVSPCTVDIGDVGGLTSVKDIAEYAKRKAADDLEFSRHNDIANRKANCVVYALDRILSLEISDQKFEYPQIFRQKNILPIATASSPERRKWMS